MSGNNRMQVGISPSEMPSRAPEHVREPAGLALALSVYDVTVLQVARKRTLRRKLAGNLTCPGSIEPNVGWWAQASWGGEYVDAGYGGPWSVELIADLCARGLLGVRPDPGNKAEITKAGRKALKATEEGSRAASQAPGKDALASDLNPSSSLPSKLEQPE